MTDFAEVLHRQAAFSRSTFGPGDRTEGVLDHISKEIEEVRNENDPYKKVEEFIDIAILAFDGAMRVLHNDLSSYHSNLDFGAIADEVFYTYLRKLDKNELRNWPDWRTADPNKAIEHVRG